MELLSKLGIDYIGVLYYVVNFGLLFLLVWKFAYRPLTKFLDDRKHHIINNLNESEKLKQELEEQKEFTSREIQKTRDELMREVEKVKEELALEKEEARKEAAKEKERIIKEGETILRAQKAELINTTKEQVVSIVENMLRNLIGELPDVTIQKSVKSSWDKFSK